MAASPLPELILRGTAILILALGIGLVATHTVLAALAAHRSTLPHRTRIILPAAVGVFLTLWLAAAITVADGHAFPLVHENQRQLVSAAIGFGPALIAIGLLFGSRALGGVNAATPAPWLIWAQTYRVAGLMFLYPFLYYGVVPAAFAIPAAVGDFLVGAAAPFVGIAVARRRPYAASWATAWNIFGIVDLIVAPAAAVLSQAQVLDMYPLSLIPLFIGPPLGIVAHVYSLRNLHHLWPEGAFESGTSMRIIPS